MTGAVDDNIRDDELRAELTDSQWHQCVVAWRETNRIGWGLSLREIAERKGFVPRAANRPGELIPKFPDVPGFEIEAEIARGAMGVVYRAKQASLGRTLALKLLDERMAQSKQFVRRFMREARLAARLDHPNIVRVFLAGESQGICYLAMEYVEGRSLADILLEDAPIGEERAVGIIKEVASALEHAHARGVLHRDIKPSNILIDKEGHAKLTDLGLAKEIVGIDDLQREGHTVGTPAYMSPELCRGREDVDARTDIYSLGATLYHMLTGTPPFTGVGRRKILEKAAAGAFEHVRDRNPEVSPGAAAIVHKMLARNPASRYQSADKLLDAIKAWERGEPIEPVSPALPEIVEPSKTHLKGRKSIFVVVTIVLVALFLVFYLFRESPVDILDRAQELATAGDLEGALQAYDRLVSKFPDSNEAVAAAALADVWRMDREAELRLKEADGLYDSGDFEDAMAVINRLKEDYGESSLIADAERLSNRIKEDGYRHYLTEFENAIEQEDWPVAETAAESALKFKPDSEEAAEAAATAKYQMLMAAGRKSLTDERLEEALDFFRQALAIKETEEAGTMAARVESEIGAIGIAREIIDEIEAADPMGWEVDDSKINELTDAREQLRNAAENPEDFGIEWTHTRPTMLYILEAIDDEHAYDDLIRLAKSDTEYPELKGEPEPRYAIESLGRIGVKSLPTLVKMLEGEDIDRATWSAGALSRLGGPAVVPLYQVALSDDERLSNAAVDALRMIGPPAAGRLALLLTHPREEIAEGARNGLLALGPLALDGIMEITGDLDRAGLDAVIRTVAAMGKGAVPDLLKIYSNRPGLPRHVSERAISYLDDQERGPALLEGTRDEDVAVRNAALDFLARLGAGRMMPYLLQEVIEAGELPSSHESIINRWGEAGENELRGAFLSRADATRRAAEIALSDMKGKGVPILGVIAADTSRERNDRMRALDILADAGVVAVSELLNVAAADETAVSDRAVRMILGFEDEAYPYLLEARDHRNASIRLQAARLLWRARGSYALPDLTRMLRDSSERVRLTVLGYFAEEADERYIDNIAPLLRDRSYDVRSAAVNALIVTDSAKAVEVILSAIAQRPPIDLEELKTKIAGMGARAMPALREAFHDRDYPARAHVLEMIGAIGGGEATDLLIVALDDTYLEVRMTAARELGKLGARRAVSSLVRRLRMELRGDVREAIVWALGEIGDPDYFTSVRYIIDRMNRDTTLIVKLAAVEALGKIWSRDAILALQDAASNHDHSTVRRAAREELRRRGHTFRLY